MEIQHVDTVAQKMFPNAKIIGQCPIVVGITESISAFGPVQYWQKVAFHFKSGY